MTGILHQFFRQPAADYFENQRLPRTPFLEGPNDPMIREMLAGISAPKGLAGLQPTGAGPMSITPVPARFDQLRPIGGTGQVLGGADPLEQLQAIPRQPIIKTVAPQQLDQTEIDSLNQAIAAFLSQYLPGTLGMR